MAYNVLKGNVEGSVDQHADQHIDGVKVFKNTVSASVFYDTDAEGPCVTSKDVAFSHAEGSRTTGLITFEGEKKTKIHHNLSFDGNNLVAPKIHAQSVRASGAELTDLPADRFNDKIKATFLDLGAGLHSVRGTLQVKAESGLQNSEEGLTLNISSTGGLDLRSKKLVINPAKAPLINNAGQNLSDADILLVGDVSRGSVHGTTLQNLYESYITSKIPKAAGTLNELQFKGKRGFASSDKLSYDTNTDTLKVGGTLSATTVSVEKSLSCGGAVIKNIDIIQKRNYEVGPGDYTLVCDTVKNPITVTLPPACNHAGRILVVKKSNTDKYNLRSYPVRITTLEGTIDLNDEQVIKTNYSARTLQSDGSVWHIIGSKGS